MRWLSVLFVLAAVASAGWLSFVFLMRRTYFRPLAHPDAESSAYQLALSQGELLASDFYGVGVFCSILLAIAGVLLFLAYSRLDGLGSTKAVEPTGSATIRR